MSAAEMFTRELLDTRKPGGDGSGVILELLRDGTMRVIVIVHWPSSGLLAQYDTLTQEQTRELRNRLAQALPPMLADLAPPQGFAYGAPDSGGPGYRTLAPAEEMHATRDREMHAAPGVWENPFAAEGET